MLTRQLSTKIVPKARRIFSGIQPTGKIHLGNYFGAVRQWVALQNSQQYQHTIYSIVDLHALTFPQKREELHHGILEGTATLLACGIDPAKSTFFLQSQVSLHTQLAWILGCLTTMPKLAQLPQFKEKIKSVKDVPLGLYTYPVLQAADILLYKATDIPIGEDNIHHIQLTHHLAKGFNRIYGETFVMPEALIEGGMWKRLRSLRQPNNKMSKSEPDRKSRISLNDTPEDILEKIKKAVTDSTSQVTYDPNTRPGVSNLIQIHSLCSGLDVDTICNHMVGVETGKYKLEVADCVIEFLRPIRSQIIEFLEDPGHLLKVLNLGAEKANSLAQPVWDTVCSKVGIPCQSSSLPNYEISCKSVSISK